MFCSFRAGLNVPEIGGVFVSGKHVTSFVSLHR